MKKRRLLLVMTMTFCCLGARGAMPWTGNEMVSQQVSVNRQLVYSVSADGYVNIRQRANARSKVVGVLATGRKGAVLIAKQNNWWKVSIDGVKGYVNSKYVKLSAAPVAVAGLPTYYYTVVASCPSMEKVKEFFYSCPDALDGLPVYKTESDGNTVYRVCQSCHSTHKGAEEAAKMLRGFLGRDDACWIWETKGLAECVYLPIGPSGEHAIPLTPQK